jgi:DNA repair protein RecN (Recombination protein N)
MLVELAVTDLGVIAEARIPFTAGMTALTGETGAGKTMVVEALGLLAGARADPSRVRPGADQAVVEGLFAVGDEEWALRRVVPRNGRSRCYLNGELGTAAQLAELCGQLLEIHGQHGQQALLSPRHQREALDRFAGVDRRPLDEARGRARRLREELDALGGDERARTRQVELLAHQVAEIERFAPVRGEDAALDAEEDLLSDAIGHRDAGAEAVAALSGEGAAGDLLAAAAAALAGRAPYDAVRSRLLDAAAELADCAREARGIAEGIEPDEERLAEVRARRHGLVELRRKYGEDVAEILAFAEHARAELVGLEAMEGRRAVIGEEIAQVDAEVARLAAEVGALRRSAAGELADAVGAILVDLALPGACVEVAVADSESLPGAGEAVELRISTNPGSPPGPLSKVASGGELSRVMLALRLVLSGGPPTMVFDEVDAGIGGRVAGAVAAALARLGEQTQVLVVTHLAQVAAAADMQVLVDKQVVGAGGPGPGATLTSLRVLGVDERVEEISRMLSGATDSRAAREHAAELLGDQTVGAGRRQARAR